MLCHACNRDVHPVVELFAGADGIAGGFLNKCPTEGCGAKLDSPPPITVSANSDEEVAMLEGEIALLQEQPLLDMSEAENAEQIRRLQRRLSLLRNPRPKAAPKTIAPPVAELREPASGFVGATPIGGAPVIAAPVFATGNIVELMRARHAALSLELRQIEAMLTVAQSIQ